MTAENAAWEQALGAVLNGMSIRAAAKTFKVGREALRCRIEGTVPVDAKRGRRPQYLALKQEEEIIQAIAARSQTGVCIEEPELRSIIRQCALAHNPEGLPASFPNKRWAQRFIDRHKESVRKLQMSDGKRGVKHNVVASVPDAGMISNEVNTLVTDVPQIRSPAERAPHQRPTSTQSQLSREPESVEQTQLMSSLQVEGGALVQGSKSLTQRREEYADEDEGIAEKRSISTSEKRGRSNSQSREQSTSPDGQQWALVVSNTNSRIVEYEGNEPVSMVDIAKAHELGATVEELEAGMRETKRRAHSRLAVRSKLLAQLKVLNTEIEDLDAIYEGFRLRRDRRLQSRNAQPSDSQLQGQDRSESRRSSKRARTASGIFEEM